MVPGKVKQRVWVDTGGMFKDAYGITEISPGVYKAFAQDGWGGGMTGKPFSTIKEAMTDIPRVAKKYLGIDI